MRAFKIALGIFGVCFGSLVWAAEANVAGTASIVAGTVSATALNGETRTLAKDDAVYSGDRISTGPSSYVRLGFLDGGSMVLRPNTEFAIEAFRFQPGVVESAVQLVPPKAAPAPANASPALTVSNQGSIGNQAFFRLVRGGFRAVSGLVGKLNREEYAVRTPVATIGIRGTVFWSVVCDASCAGDSMVQGVLPSGEQAIGGVVSAVDQGSTVMVSSTGQSVTVNASQFMFTTAAGTHIVLPGLPGFLSAEGWLSTVGQASAASPAPAASSALADGVLATAPTLGGIAASVLIGAVVLSTNMDDAGTNGTATSTTPAATTTSTTR